MSIFKKLNRKINRAVKTVAAPENTVYYHGEYVQKFTTEEELPDDFKALELMARYYGHGTIAAKSDRDKYYPVILRKLYSMIKEGKGEDRFNYTEDYFAKAAPQDEMDKHHFKIFCTNIENGFLSQELLYDGRKDTYIKGVFNNSSFKNSMPHFEKRLPEIIHSVCVLLEKEKHPSSIRHMGYYMYQDLMDYLKNDDPLKTFSFGYPDSDKHYLWKKTHEYLRHTNKYCNALISKPEWLDTVMGKEAREGYTQGEAEAKANMEFCSEKEIMAVYKASVNSTMESRDERRAKLENMAENNDVSALLALAKDYFHGISETVTREYKAYPLFMQAFKLGSAEAMYYLGLYYEKGLSPVREDMAKADEYLANAMALNHMEAYFHVAEREYRSLKNKALALKYYKKVLPTLSEKDETKKCKTVLSRIIACSNTRDVSEDTLGIYAMAADYARLDAPIVKEYDLLELLAEVEKGQISALNRLEYYYSYYSRGRAAMGTIAGSEIFETDYDRAIEMRYVADGFRLMKIAMLLDLAARSPENYLGSLAEAYLDQGNHAKAREYTELGIQMNLADVMYLVYQKGPNLGYDEEEAMMYLKQSAALGYNGAIGALEYLSIMEEGQRERAAWVAANKPKPKSRAEYSFKLELMERDVNMMLGGSGYSVDELAAMGKISYPDASLIRHYKNKFLDSLTEE